LSQRTRSGIPVGCIPDTAGKENRMTGEQAAIVALELRMVVILYHATGAGVLTCA